MEPAQQHEVHEIGPTALRPPTHVVRVGVSPSFAPREPTRAVAPAERAHHSRRWRPAEPPKHQRGTRDVVERDLKASVARQALRGDRGEHRTVLDLGVGGVGATEQGLDRCMHHQRGPIVVGVCGDAPGTQLDQRVRSADL